jgi:hypothetical protein
MKSQNEVLCAAAGRLAAERSEADKPANNVSNLLTIASKGYVCNQCNSIVQCERN